MRKGFTLVELSIVLVIIGLLIGGILVAQSMIGTAKIQAAIRQYGQYEAAIANFRTRYNQLPGDTTLISQPGMISNNNGLIEIGTNSPATYEVGKFWADLSSGVGLKNSVGTNYTVWNPHVEYPQETQSPVFNLDQYKSNISNRPALVAGTVDGITNYMWYVEISGIGGIVGDYDPLKTKDALALDTKLDNGLPSSGKVIGSTSGALTVGNCVSGTNYDVATNNYLCSLRMDFGTVSGMR